MKSYDAILIASLTISSSFRPKPFQGTVSDGLRRKDDGNVSKPINMTFGNGVSNETASHAIQAFVLGLIPSEYYK